MINTEQLWLASEKSIAYAMVILTILMETIIKQQHMKYLAHCPVFLSHIGQLINIRSVRNPSPLNQPERKSVG